jgi:hypothetical protein
MAIFEGHDPFELGELLPLVSEFWFSSTHSVLGRILERPFPTIAVTVSGAKACSALF